MGKPQGYYIYTYLDGDEPFYIGKGLGNRAWYHLHPHSRDKGTPFYQVLEAKLQNGWEPDILIIKDELKERQAYEIEAILIELVGMVAKGTGPLYNMQTIGAFTRAIAPGKEVTCWGEEFSNLRALANDARSCLTYEELKSRRRRWHNIGRKWDLEEALSFPIQLPTLYHYCGEEFRGLAAISRDSRCKVPLSLLEKRMQKDWPIEEAATMPPPDALVCWGEVFPDMRAVSEDPRCVVTYGQLQKRTYHRGKKPHWDIERAATTPIDTRFSRKPT